MNAPIQLDTLRGQTAPPRPLAQMKPREQIAYLLESKKGELAKMLPKTLSIERLLKVAQIAATTTPALAKCDVASLVGAIGQCAQMGLEPNTPLGHAYLVPFNTKRKDADGQERWVNSVQVIIGYKGLIDLARRSGQIVSIAAHEVCEKDRFELVYGLDEKLNHTPELGDRGGLIGFYAVAKLKDGGHCFEFMSVHQVQEIMKATQSKGKYGPWMEHFVEMGRKTVIRRLAKYLPLSIEFQTAAALDSMAEVGKDQNNTIEGSFSFVPDDAPSGDAGVDQETGEIQERLTGEAEAKVQVQAAMEAERYVSAKAFVKAKPAPAFDANTFAERLESCKDVDTLDLMADEIRDVTDADTAATMSDIYLRCRDALVDAKPAPAATGRRARGPSPSME